MFRPLALVVTASLLLAGCGAAPLVGAASSTGGEMEANRRVKKQAQSELEHLVVNSVTALRDGGTLIVKGYVSRSTAVTIKLDGGLSSPTRGQFFIAIHDFMKAEGTLRPLAADEVAPLLKGLKANTTRAGADLNVQALTRVIDRLDSYEVAADGPFAGLEVLSIEALPVRCPCFALKARTKGGDTITIEFTGFGNDYTIDEVKNGVMSVSDTESRKQLGKALTAAAGQHKDKEKAAMIKAVAAALAK